MTARTMGLEIATHTVLSGLAALRAQHATIHLAWGRRAVERWIRRGATR